jgi:murein DD-endopeptidase MepM/ murein hydrolase activator NlpD
MYPNQLIRLKHHFVFFIIIISLFISTWFEAPMTQAKETTENPEQIYEARRHLFEQVSSLTGIPWYYLAAIDQYERALTKAKPKSRPQKEGYIAIHYEPHEWVGLLNPDEKDTNLFSIQFFGGKGRDGSGDGKADLQNDLDVLYTIAQHILTHGSASEDFRIGLWEHYQNSRSVERIEQFSKIYETFDTLDFRKNAFPLPVRSEYSFRSTWGAKRSYGGYRIHEGTDLFAGYGTPVRSTCYGYIEIMGWNRFGGWRVGIRDTQNVYHYYAHLSGFNKEVKQGDIVKPGQVVGWVGSSGYGKPGTQGKFPPHLHYGMYRDNGFTEWSFDPYPYLKRWEREERNS